MTDWVTVTLPADKRLMASTLAEHAPDVLAFFKEMSATFGPSESVAYSGPGAEDLARRVAAAREVG